MLEVADILELDTKPYIVMSLLGNHQNYSVKFVSQSFKVMFLQNKLLKRKIGGTNKAKNKKRKLLLEDLVFSKVSEEQLRDYTGSWISDDSDKETLI